MQKDSKLIVRVSEELKTKIVAEAAIRGESESVIVREALREYFASRGTSSLNDATNRTHAHHGAHGPPTYIKRK